MTCNHQIRVRFPVSAQKCTHGRVVRWFTANELRFVRFKLGTQIWSHISMVRKQGLYPCNDGSIPSVTTKMEAWPSGLWRWSWKPLDRLKNVPQVRILPLPQKNNVKSDQIYVILVMDCIIGCTCVHRDIYSYCV